MCVLLHLRTTSKCTAHKTKAVNPAVNYTALLLAQKAVERCLKMLTVKICQLLELRYAYIFISEIKVNKFFKIVLFNYRIISETSTFKFKSK